MTAHLPDAAALEGCWAEDALDLDAFGRLLAEAGLPCGGAESTGFALICARMLAAGWAGTGQGGVSRFALYDLNGDGRLELLTDSGGTGGIAVYAAGGPDFQHRVFQEGGAYTELGVLEGGVLWLHDGSRLTIYDRFYRLEGDTMACLHDLERTPVPAGGALCLDGGWELPEAAYHARLDACAALPELGEADGFRWQANNRPSVSDAFADLISAS